MFESSFETGPLTVTPVVYFWKDPELHMGLGIIGIVASSLVIIAALLKCCGIYNLTLNVSIEY